VIFKQWGNMIEILKSLSLVAVGVGGLLALLGGLYWLASQLQEPWRERLRTAVFVGPALLLLLGLVVPALLNFRFSFYDKRDEWYGLGNYRDIFTKEDNIKVFSNTLWWGVIVTGGQHHHRHHHRPLRRPHARRADRQGTDLPAHRHLDGGRRHHLELRVLPQAVRPAQLDAAPPGADPSSSCRTGSCSASTARWIPGLNSLLIMVVVIWIQAGFSTVVISAALKGVPDDLVEAAKIDGATDRQAFYKVVLPYIKGTIITVATTTVLAVLKIFDIIQTMGKGGLFGTSTIANEMYETAFTARTTTASAPPGPCCCSCWSSRSCSSTPATSGQ
jgi:alpha-glucoside transport system permease protein